MSGVFTMRAQINLRAETTEAAFVALSEHFTRLAKNEEPDQKVFCGGMLLLDPAEAEPTGMLIPTRLMHLIHKCGGNAQLLPQHERFELRQLLAMAKRQEAAMQPPTEGKVNAGSQEVAASPVSEPAPPDPGQHQA